MRVDFFPHGATQSNKGNMWRETEFALNLVQQAVNPRLNLQKCIENWDIIKIKLSEKPRSRKGQMDKIIELS